MKCPKQYGLNDYGHLDFFVVFHSIQMKTQMFSWLNTWAPDQADIRFYAVNNKPQSSSTGYYKFFCCSIVHGHTSHSTFLTLRKRIE